MHDADHTIDRSFHRSMQSAAFLPILLMFVAISSRMRALCLELQNVLQQAVSNLVSLLPAVTVSFLAGLDKVISYDQIIINQYQHTAVPTATLGPKDMTGAPLEPSVLSTSGTGEYEQHGTPSLPPHQMAQQGNTLKHSLSYLTEH
jgi:hypothetical protein